MTREVQAPDGRVWRVRRRWVPKTPRLRRRSESRDDWWSWWDLPSLDFDGDDVFAVIALVFGLVVILVFAVTVVFPLVALTLELVIGAVLFAAGLIGRLLFGRPWRIEATTIGTPKLTREIHASGLRGSREAVDRLADEIQRGGLDRRHNLSW